MEMPHLPEDVLLHCPTIMHKISQTLQGLSVSPTQSGNICEKAQPGDSKQSDFS